ncbi:hypothetical protein, partial [Imhoffiella purpurea]|uniref:hypothetical protein n=1 Tax=Imhoffiella purpurea TaxID=1249627 RepID=UPI001E457FBD
MRQESCQLPASSSQLDTLRLAAGGWRLAAGGWRLAAGGFHIHLQNDTNHRGPPILGTHPPSSMRIVATVSAGSLADTVARFV